MNQITLNISARRLDPRIKYVPFSKTERVVDVPFILTNLKEEVGREKKKNLKRFARICKVTITTSALLFGLVSPTMAASIAPVPNAILPSDIMKVGVYLIGISMAASTILAIILSQLAGGWRMLRKGEDATKWTTDILKGYTQVILAPVIIVSIAFVVYLLFGNYDWFVKLF